MSQHEKSQDLYDIGGATQGFDLSCGFLPRQEPSQVLPASCEPWQSLARELPDWLSTGSLRAEIAALSPMPLSDLTDSASFHRAMMVVSFLGHAYVWGEPDEAPVVLPESLAVTWYDIAQKIGRPPVLSYASYALNNWRKIASDRPLALDNLALLQRFLGGVDEAWFIIIHIVIESQAIPALKAIQQGIQAIADDAADKLLTALEQVGDALTIMGDTLERMPEHCDPYIYYHRVRPYIHGWKNNPALPQGLVYTGVAAYGERPVMFKGETGAQSTIIPTVDAFLGISQTDDPLKAHLVEMLDYVPPSHSAFILHVQGAEDVRDVIVQRHPEAQLITAFNNCVQQVGRFRSIHFQYAVDYIQQQQQRHSGNPNTFGTGGTPFLRYLKKHQRSCQQFLIDG